MMFSEKDKIESQPLVSIICFCKNAAGTIGRAIESILAQDYPNIQVVVQDGNSTDGTLEILKSYGSRIELVSEPDHGPGDAMFRALARVRGEFFGSCLADEQLLPHAVAWAVENLRRRPDAGGIYGDNYLLDTNGTIIGLVRPGPWDFGKFMRSEFMPTFCAAFFRTACYLEVGPRHYSGCGEFEFWLRLGAHFPIYYLSEIVAGYGLSRQQLSQQIDDLHLQAKSRKQALESLFSHLVPGSQYAHERSSAMAGVDVWLTEYYAKCGAWNLAVEAFRRAASTMCRSRRMVRVGRLIVGHGIGLAKAGKFFQAREFLRLPLEFPASFPELVPLLKTIESRKVPAGELT